MTCNFSYAPTSSNSPNKNSIISRLNYFPSMSLSSTMYSRKQSSWVTAVKKISLPSKIRQHSRSRVSKNKMSSAKAAKACWSSEKARARPACVAHKTTTHLYYAKSKTNVPKELPKPSLRSYSKTSDSKNAITTSTKSNQ